MGIRGEIFSTNLQLQNRTYFFNVKENRLGDLYLNIVESKNKDTGGFERQSVIVFADDLSAFLGEFEKSLKTLEKAVRDQKRRGSERRVPAGEQSRASRPADGSRHGTEHDAGREHGSRSHATYERSPRGRSNDDHGPRGRSGGAGGSPGAGRGGKRIVVKKKD
ncbi:hypothetical protein FACS1894161_1890 [Spirochaetia bacterium]|nr:hypothetical protein FACS1894161_1890 [Spirochaetia bacterium]